MTENGQGSGYQGAPQPGYPAQPGVPQSGAPWGEQAGQQPQPEPEPEFQPQHQDQAQHQPQPEYGYPAPPHQPGQPAYGYPPQAEASYGYPQPGYPAAQPPVGHVVGPGFEGPGDPHGYGYPPLPEAVTQYIPPIPAGPAHGEAATQYIPPIPAGPAHGEAATQYIPPVPAAPAQDEAATQYIPPVPAGPMPNAAEGFDGLFRGDDSAGHTQHLPPIQEPVLRQSPPRPYPPRGQGPVRPQQSGPQQPGSQQPGSQQYAPPPQQFQAAPPVPAEPARRVSPAIIAAVVIGLAVVGLGVGALLSDNKPQNTDPGAVAPVPTGSGGSAAAVGEAPVDPARPQAVQLDKLLADSNDSRASVIKAVDDIKGCRNLDQAADDLRDAARQRDELVTRLQELKLDLLPDHAKLSAALTKAWKSSAAADNSYAAWADDVDDGKKNCKDGQAKSTGNAAAGNRASGEATKAKESAATMWNAIAAKYSLTKRDKSQL
ncbi:hypothetical protein MTF65_29825 [Streptomyces sp. APSN-46.1]|uniref:hypothetical protein n=1 Tax=Streptomyces sp. APSN-46.1 TaxID=2929049 RepID=UPI001FB1CB4F|nr:hypothetical protein [Streptomyces sp. APSN-46.1]MCJ1681480.1 hypothetical protein [Streptomyces sp. APSN-46.1]